MKIGFYPGSFDPFTIGHLEVVKKACQIFDQVIIGIGDNPHKTRRFDKDKMYNAIFKTILNEGLEDKVKIISFHGISAEIAKDYDAVCLIKGIRNTEDYEYEEKTAKANAQRFDIDTIYIRSGDYCNISSSMVYECHLNKEDISQYVSEPVFEVIHDT